MQHFDSILFLQGQTHQGRRCRAYGNHELHGTILCRLRGRISAIHTCNICSLSFRTFFTTSYFIDGCSALQTAAVPYPSAVEVVEISPEASHERSLAFSASALADTNLCVYTVEAWRVNCLTHSLYGNIRWPSTYRKEYAASQSSGTSRLTKISASHQNIPRVKRSSCPSHLFGCGGRLHKR